MPAPYEDDEDTLVNDADGIGGEDYFPMEEEAPAGEVEGGEDPDAFAGEETPAEEALEEEPGAEMKPGAAALTELHDHLLDLAEVVGRLSASQEHPEVQRHLDKTAASFDKITAGLLDLFGKLYPDHESPAPPPAPGELEKSEGLGEGSGADGGFTAPGEEGDEPEEEDEEAGKINKRLRLRFTKRVAAARAWRDLLRTKRVSKSHAGVIAKAADYLEDVADHDGEFTQHHKAAAGYHGAGLRKICKGYAEMESGTAGDLARGGVPGAVEKALAARLRQYEERVPRLHKMVKQLQQQLTRALAGR